MLATMLPYSGSIGLQMPNAISLPKSLGVKVSFSESKFLKKNYLLTSGSCLFIKTLNLYIEKATMHTSTRREVIAPGVVLNELSPL